MGWERDKMNETKRDKESEQYHRETRIEARAQDRRDKRHNSICQLTSLWKCKLTARHVWQMNKN